MEILALHYKFGDLAIGAEIAKLNDFTRYRNTLGLYMHRKKVAKFLTTNIFVGGSTAKIAKLNARQYISAYTVNHNRGLYVKLF